MVETRRRNKRVTYVDESAPDEDDFEEDDFHDAPSVPVPISVAAPTTSSVPLPIRSVRRSKRRKRGDEDIIASMDMLCDDVVTHVYNMLGSVRDVYSFALCSKRIHNLLTPRIVIRSAVFQGGHAATSIEEIAKAVKRKSIFVPDTFRLLRVVNGRRCERLDECWSYNLETGLSGTATVVSPGIGMFFCRKCVTAMTTVLQGRSLSWVSKEEKLATTPAAGYYRRAVHECSVEAVTGNPCGPKLCLLDIKQVEATYRDEDDCREAIKCLLEESDDDDVYSQQGSMIVETFENAEQDLEDLRARRYRVREAQERERHGKRLAKLQAMVGRLESLLADAPWKELALACSWQDNLSWFPSVFFGCRIVRHIMQRLVSAPSSCSQKKLKAAAEKITTEFNLLYEKDIFSFSCLAASSDAFERGLYQYCRENITPEKFLKSIPWEVEPWLEKVRSDNLREAVMNTFDRNSMALKEVFATAVVSSESVIGLGLDVSKFHTVAHQVWLDNSDELASYIISSRELFRNFRNMCRDRYMERETSLVDFLTSSETRNWLERAEDHNRDLPQGIVFTRQNAVDQVFTKPGCRLFLRTRSFERLLSLVERYYQHPQRYNLLSDDA